MIKSLGREERRPTLEAPPPLEGPVRGRGSPPAEPLLVQRGECSHRDSNPGQRLERPL